jgi:hypothetical protein
VYLPEEIPGARVLITVKTYPLPSGKYDELVCTAGFLSDGKWIRLYPIPFRALPYGNQYSKYHWVTVDLVRNRKDFRPESYRPKHDVESLEVGEKIGTGKNRDWQERKQFVLNEVFTSMGEIIKLAKSEVNKSLATLKPRQIEDLIIEPDEREWKAAWRDQLLQYNLFDVDEQGQGKTRSVLRKLPYKYFYKFTSEGDTRPHKLMIEDWELGALYWRCYNTHNHDEKKANALVREKYLDEFRTKDIYFFLGTTQQFHNIAPNPFIIIGLFVPPKPRNRALENMPPNTLQTDGIQQQRLFD